LSSTSSDTIRDKIENTERFIENKILTTTNFVEDFEMENLQKINYSLMTEKESMEA